MSTTAKVKPIVYESIIMRQTTPFKQQGSNVALRRGTFVLGNENICIIDDEGNTRTMRFIKSSTTNWKDEQIKNGLLDTYKLRQADMDALTFVNLRLVAYPGRDKKLIEYLDAHNGNESNDRRNPELPVSFYRVNAEANAGKSLDSKMEYLQAMKIVERLRHEAPLYRQYVNLFGLPENESMEEHLDHLMTVALGQPKLILNAVNRVKNSLADIVMDAFQLGILKLTNTEIQFSSGDKIIGLKASTPLKEAQIKLVQHLEKAEGKLTLEMLTNQIENAKLELTS